MPGAACAPRTPGGPVADAATREALDRFWFTLATPVRGLVDGPQTQTETEREEAVRREAIAEAQSAQVVNIVEVAA